VDASRDSNPIHTEDSVISGAMTAARLLLLPEILVPSLQVRSLRIKFRAFSRYDRATVNRFSFVPNGQGAYSVELAVMQEGVSVAQGVLKTISVAEQPTRGGHGANEYGQVGGGSGTSHTLVESKFPPCAPAEVIRNWYRSLRVDPDGAFECLGYGYPRAFLASLPSGEMLRKGGAVGLLNALNLEFPEPGIPALNPETLPTVEVAPVRPRKSFHKVLANVASGMVTYCTGYATVLMT